MTHQTSHDDRNDAHQPEDSAKRPFNPDGGEDEGSASHDGDDGHLHDDQKPVVGGSQNAGGLDADDPHKTEKMTDVE